MHRGTVTDDHEDQTMKYPLIVAAIALLQLAPVAHSQNQPRLPTTKAVGTASDTGTLSSYLWRLSNATTADGTPIRELMPHPDNPLELDFSHDRLSVRNGCNLLTGPFHMTGGRLDVGQLLQTRKFCSDSSLMRLDDAIAQRLESGLRLYLQLEAAGATLALVAENGDSLVFNGKAR
jgi:heat shock protein HslJ